MELQVLISTMYQKNYELINKMKVQSNAIIVNQCNEESIKKFSYKGSRIKWINSKKRGLSCSRNIALENATDDICILADDDLEYISNYKDIILNQFELYPGIDIIAFQVDGIEQTFKEYYPRLRKINYLTSMKISSVEIAFRLDSIRRANIQFNELFGAGAKYNMGEENIFLVECLKKGLQVMYVPIKIANLHIGESTWFNGYNKEYFINKGAAFASMSKWFSMLLIIQFAVRKYKLFKNKITIFQAINQMLEGRRRFLIEKQELRGDEQ